MSRLFQNEPDENESCFTWVEPDEEERLFQPEHEEEPSQPVFVLPDEPDECDEDNEVASNERDEAGSSNESAYDGDVDDVGPDSASQRALCEMSFKTLNSFLNTQLCKPISERSTQQPKKKRCYDNSKRAMQAASKRASKPQPNTRLARNDPEASAV